MRRTLHNVKLNSDHKQLVVQYTDDVEPVLEHNKTLRSIQDKGEWFRHKATIPTIVMLKWLNEEWQRGNTDLRYMSTEFNDLVKRKLKDPDYAYLLTDAPRHRIGYR